MLLLQKENDARARLDLQFPQQALPQRLMPFLHVMSPRLDRGRMYKSFKVDFLVARPNKKDLANLY